MTLQVSWFTANPNFHPIPVGYGLPWGTAGEKDIPGTLVFQSEMELAKAQLKTQTPPYQTQPVPPPASGDASDGSLPNSSSAAAGQRIQGAASGRKQDVQAVSHEEASNPAAAKPS